MAYTTFQTQSSLDDGANSNQANTTHLQINAQNTVELPDASFVRDADITRDGTDLVLQTDSGTVVIDGYFAQSTPPNLVAPDGTMLTHNLVESFIRSDMRFADATNGVNDASPVGAVQEISGEATVTRADGSVENIGLGTPIYQGDVIETSAEGAVNIVFLDDTSFAVSNDARLAIDEYVFDPSTQSGESNFSVLKGVFVFTSGLIGRDDPDDVQIETPAGSIGIRGTIIAGNVDTGEITVVEGAIVLKDFNGNSITLSNQYETARFNTAGGDIEHIGDLSASDVSSKFMSVSTVAADLFSSIQDNSNDNAQDNKTQQQANEPAKDAAPADAPKDAAAEGEDHSALPPAQVITSGDIATAGSEFNATPTQNGSGSPTTGSTATAQNTAPTIAAPQPPAELAPKAPALDNTERPPFSLSVTKMEFVENSAAQQTVAIIKGNFTLSTSLQIEGPANNFYVAQRIDANSFRIALKPGVSIDHEHAPALTYAATNAVGGAIIKQKIDLDVLNVNEPTTLTNAAPNEMFKASDGNRWVYDFANEFKDPDGDIKGYSYDLSTLPSGTTTNAALGNSKLAVNFDDLSSDGNITITVHALDANGNTLNTVVKTLTYINATENMVAGGDYYPDGSDILSISGNSDETVSIITGSNNYVFSDGGDDDLSVTGSNNLIHAGAGNDEILVEGSGNYSFGDEGHDTFTINTTSNKSFGGDGADTFNIDSASVLSGTGTLINGNEGLDKLHLNNGGNIDFTAINNDYVKNIEILSSVNGSANTITLSRSDVIAMTDDSNVLRIDMDNNDNLVFTNDSGGTMNFHHIGKSANGHEIFTDGVVTLLVSDEGSHNAII